MLLVTILVLAAAPVKPLPMLPAPLGHLGDLVEAPPTGGIPGGQTVLIGKLDGCEREQALYLSRLLSGALTAVEQLQAWLKLTPDLEKKLFAPGKLGEVSQLAAASAHAGQKACEVPARSDGFKLELTRAPAKLCAAAAGFRIGDFAWTKEGKLAALLSLAEAPATSKDRCRPRFSIALFDRAGVARVRLHADFGGAASVSILGDKCVGLDFNFDEASQAFVPTWRSVKPCKG